MAEPQAFPVQDSNEPAKDETKIQSEPAEDATNIQKDTAALEGNPSLAGSVAHLPAHLRSLARQIKKLKQGDLLRVAELTAKAAHRDVFSLVEYTGSNWYLPNITQTEDGEARWSCSYSTGKHELQMAVGGMKMTFRVFSYFLRISFLVALWFTCWCILPATLVQPRGWVWDPCVTVIVSAVVGGILCRILQLPPIVGVLWIGIMWNNIPEVGFLTSFIHKDVRSIASRTGLTLILVRSGFSLNLKVVKPIWRSSLALSFVSMGCETAVHGALAQYMFDFPNWTWAYLQAMLCSVLSPAIVVPGVLLLQEQGYGKGQSALTLMLSSVGFETVCGVWAVNFIIGIIFDKQDLGLAIALGPIQFLGGAIGGIFLGWLYVQIVELLKAEADRLPNGKYSEAHLKSVISRAFYLFLAIPLAIHFLGYRVKLAGGGALVAMLFPATVAHLWTKDGIKELEDHKKEIGVRLGQTWDLVVMPFLFSMTGSAINLGTIFNTTFFPKAIGIVAMSGTVRALAVMISTLGVKLPFYERVFLSISWLAKAGAQGAMAGLALERALLNYDAAPIEERHIAMRDVVWATNVRNMAILYIIVYAPISAICVTKLGPITLVKSTDEVKVPKATSQAATELVTIPVPNS